MSQDYRAQINQVIARWMDYALDCYADAECCCEGCLWDKGLTT